MDHSRIPVAMVGATAMTLALFFLMHALIARPPGALDRDVDGIFIPFTNEVPEDEPIPQKIRIQPPERTEPPPSAPTAVAQDPQTHSFDLPSMPPTVDSGRSGPRFGGNAVRADLVTAQPTVRMPPIYPRDELVNHIEGYVIFSYTVGPFGNVENLRIVEAHPRGKFEDAVRKAVSRWILAPASGVQTERIDFRLTDD